MKKQYVIDATSEVSIEDQLDVVKKEIARKIERKNTPWYKRIFGFTRKG